VFAARNRMAVRPRARLLKRQGQCQSSHIAPTRPSAVRMMCGARTGGLPQRIETACTLQRKCFTHCSTGQRSLRGLPLRSNDREARQGDARTAKSARVATRTPPSTKENARTGRPGQQPSKLRTRLRDFRAVRSHACCGRWACERLQLVRVSQPTGVALSSARSVVASAAAGELHRSRHAGRRRPAAVAGHSVAATPDTRFTRRPPARRDPTLPGTRL